LRNAGLLPAVWHPALLVYFAAQCWNILDASGQLLNPDEYIQQVPVHAALRPGSSAMTTAERLLPHLLAEPVSVIVWQLIMNDLSPGSPDHGLPFWLGVFR